MLLPGAADPAPGAFDAFLNAAKPLIPIPALAAIVPLVYRFFRKTWRELDLESQRLRAAELDAGTVDKRPMVALVLCALILTMQEYYGGRGYYEEAIHPHLSVWDARHSGALRIQQYEELYSFGWWVATRVFGYVIVPLPFWKLVFRKDSLLDMGLRTKGFLEHAWIYGLFLGCVLPAMWLVSRQPDFGTYYPFYKQSSRSWFDFLAWEAMYFLQFFALEIFFRGFWLGALRRSLGSAAIFAMAVPYCMIHYGKPYLEANGAIIAGIALGSLSMKTKSIYQGFLVHITVAGLMDWLSLSHRKALPKVWFPSDPLTFDAKGNPVDAGGEIVLRVLLGVLATVVVALLVPAAVRAWRARRVAFAPAQAVTEGPGPEA